MSIVDSDVTKMADEDIAKLTTGDLVASETEIHGTDVPVPHINRAK